jgi:hypothetical protein
MQFEPEGVAHAHSAFNTDTFSHLFEQSLADDQLVQYPFCNFPEH